MAGVATAGRGEENTHAASANCCSTNGEKHSKMTSTCAYLIPPACDNQ